MLTKTRLKQVLKKYNIRLKKRLGQNFLIDKNIKDKIIEKADIKKTDTVLEIGSGLGALTEDLAQRAERLVAVERDEALCRILNEIMGPHKNAMVVEADILEFDLGRFRSLKVIGNLPYYITSPVIQHLLEFRDSIDSILITVQKEVAQRLVASPGTKDYGSLTLYVQYYTEPKIEMMIKKYAFFPQPEVDSSLVKLKIREHPAVSVKNEELLFKVIRASFGQRRKTLANALKTICHETKSILNSVDIDPKRRGETLSLKEFAKLAKAFDNFI